jgi:hypothetical protein
LETYDGQIRRAIKGEEVTDALLARAAVSGAFKAAFISASEGLPKAEKDLDAAPARLTWWMARELSAFIGSIKKIDPK